MKRVLLEDRPSSVDVADRRGRSAGVAAEAGARRHVGDVARPVDVEFSLAIHTHTGKYFIGRDILAAAPDLVGNVYYWLLARGSPPTGLFGKVVGRLAHIHACATTQGGPLDAQAASPGSRTAAAPPRPVLDRHGGIAPVRRRAHPRPRTADPSAAVRSRHQSRLPADLQEIARVGPHLVFVSQTSEREFWRLFPSARAASRRVIYPAIRAEVGGGAEEAPPGVAGRFLLTVGSIGTRKNQLHSLRAFAASGLAARGVRLRAVRRPRAGLRAGRRACPSDAWRSPAPLCHRPPARLALQVGGRLCADEPARRLRHPRGGSHQPRPGAAGQRIGRPGGGGRRPGAAGRPAGRAGHCRRHAAARRHGRDGAAAPPPWPACGDRPLRA